MPNTLNVVGEFAIAYLVYHRQYLQDALPRNRPLMMAFLFREDSLYNDLKGFVQCVIPNFENPLMAKGVPRHVSILLQMKEMSDSLKRNIQFKMKMSKKSSMG
jgi:hypothetical protein